MSNTDAEWTEQYMEAHPPQDKEVEVEVEVLARPAGWPFIRKREHPPHQPGTPLALGPQ